MASCALEKALVTVVAVSAHHRSGTFQGNSASATTGSATNMTAWFAQGTACATAEIVTAGTAGRETPVKSGLEKSINPWWKLKDCFCCQSRQEKSGDINSKQGKLILEICAIYRP